MLRNLLLHIRKKPKAIRENAALGSAGVITAVIFLLWLVSGPTGFSGEAETATEGASAFSTLTNAIKNQLSAAQERITQTNQDLEQVNLEEAVGALIATGTTPVQSSDTTVRGQADLQEVRISTTTISASSSETTP